MQPKYLIYGNFTLDDTVTLRNQVHRAAPGGNGLYAAIGAKIWSDSVGVVTRIGEDYPQENLDALYTSGIDIRGVHRDPGMTIRLWILYEEDGQRQIIYQINSGRCEYLDPTIDQFDPQGVQFAYICAMPFATQEKLLQGLFGRVRLACDAVSMIEGLNLDRYKSLKHLTGVDLFLPSEEDMLAGWGQYPDVRLMQRIFKISPKIIAVKHGNRGSEVYDFRSNRLLHIPIVPIDAIDPTGAGDAYGAGFMVGVGETDDALEAALMGTVSASFICEDFGGMHALQTNRDEARHRLETLRRLVRIKHLS